MRAPIRLFLAGGLAGLLAACAAPGDAPTGASGSQCVELFRQYDVMARSVRRPDNVTVPLALQGQQGRLRQAGCITMTRDLAGMEAVPVVPVSDGGAAIVPVSLHAGIVTSDADDARARAFFAARGVQARSVGEAGLGRRIYLGPFTTAGALEGAAGAARAAGFAHPYEVRF